MVAAWSRLLVCVLGVDAVEGRLRSETLQVAKLGFECVCERGGNSTRLRVSED